MTSDNMARAGSVRAVILSPATGWTSWPNRLRAGEHCRRYEKLRVIEPESAFWRRGIQVCVRSVSETGTDQLRVPYDCIPPTTGPGQGSPLGALLTDQRNPTRPGGCPRLGGGRARALV